MEKTLTFLVLTLVVSVMSIPIAYLVGQRSAQDRLEQRLEEERARTRTEQQALLDSLRRELDEARRAYERAQAAEPERRDRVKAERAAERTEPAVNAPSPAATISEATYASASLGMTYEEVVEAFGREGTVTLTLEDESGSVTEQYVWEWTNGDGTPGQVRLSFEDGRLDGKSYRE